VLGVLLAIVVPLEVNAQGTLRIGMQDDPDALDPAQGGTFAGRIVFTAACDKLIDVDPSLAFVAQLATSWAWAPDGLSLTLILRDGVRFQDGAAMDAEAVRANLERYRDAPESVRKAELKSVESVEVVDPRTIRLHLAHPDAPLLAVLADWAGMMLSPRGFADGTRPELPVCAGPFRVVRRVAQDRIELERFPEYWNATAIHFDRVVFRPIGDSSIRLLNLRAGQLDILAELAPTDVEALQSASNLRLQRATSLGYETISINIGHAPGNTSALARDPRVREALERAIDREVLNAVVMNGQYVPANQAQAPDTPYWNPHYPVPPRDTGAATVHGGGGRIRRDHPRARGKRPHPGHERGRLSSLCRGLEWPGRPRCQRVAVPGVRRLSELGQVLRAVVRRVAGARAGRDGHGRAAGALPAGGECLSG